LTNEFYKITINTDIDKTYYIEIKRLE